MSRINSIGHGAAAASSPQHDNDTSNTSSVNSSILQNNSFMTPPPLATAVAAAQPIESTSSSSGSKLSPPQPQSQSIISNQPSPLPSLPPSLASKYFLNKAISTDLTVNTTTYTITNNNNNNSTANSDTEMAGPLSDSNEQRAAQRHAKGSDLEAFLKDESNNSDIQVDTRRDKRRWRDVCQPDRRRQ